MSHCLAIPKVDVVAFGGGGGLLDVTWPACKALGLNTVLVETTFGTGGSSARIRACLRSGFGETPALGNLAAGLQRVLGTRMLDPLLEYRIADDDPRSLTEVVESQIQGELAAASLGRPARTVRDRLRELGRQWERARRERPELRHFRLAGHSVRNLLVLWYWLVRFEVYRGRGCTDEDRMAAALDALHKSLEIDDALVLPVSIDPGTLVARYRDPVAESTLRSAGLGPGSRTADPHVVVGQHEINLLGHSRIVDFDVCGAACADGSRPRPRAFGPVVAALEQCRLIVVGAGSFFTSLLACLGVQGILETILRRPEVPRVLFVNPYHLDQTRNLTVLDCVRFVETLAERAVGGRSDCGTRRRVRFEDVFSDVVFGTPSGDPRLLGLLEQAPNAGEARGAIRLTPAEDEQLKARGVRIHCGHYMCPQRKRLKRPGNHFIEIAGYDPLRIGTVFSRIGQNGHGTR